MNVTFTIPVDIWQAMRLPEKEKGDLLRIELAIALYQRRILSLGKSRALANISKWEFDEELGRRQIERHYDQEDLDNDLKYARS